MHTLIGDAVSHYVFTHFFGIQDASHKPITELCIGGDHNNLIVGWTHFAYTEGFLMMNMFIPAYGQEDADAILMRITESISYYAMSGRGADVKMPVVLMDVYPPIITPSSEWTHDILSADNRQITHCIRMCFVPIDNWFFASNEASSITSYILDVPTPTPRHLVSSIVRIKPYTHSVTYDNESPIIGMVMNAADWKITLEQLSADPKGEGTLHESVIEKHDGSHFKLSDTDGILDALDMFLSFQSGRWVTRSITYTLNQHNGSNARMNRLVSRGNPKIREGVTSSREDWPSLFAHFYAAYISDHDRLKRVIGGYVACLDIMGDDTISLPWTLLPLTESSLSLSITWCLGPMKDRKKSHRRAIEHVGMDKPDDFERDLVVAVNRRNDIIHDMKTLIGIRDVLESAAVFRSLSESLILQQLRDTPLVECV